MKKILFLMFFLTSFLFSEKIHCLYIIPNNAYITPLCTTNIYYNEANGYLVVRNHPKGAHPLYALNNPTITTGYSYDTITNTFQIDPIYNQIDVSDLVSQPEILIDYINNPPLYIEPEPTEPEPTEPTPTEPTPTEPTPIIPDENGLIMGLTPNDFNFSMALWGIILAFLISFGLIKSI